MGTTANNSWPYPESSDYVADGATAIENLADAIDASLPESILKVDTVNNRVGINDTTPGYDLEVNGTLNATIIRYAGVNIGEQTTFTPSWTNVDVTGATESWRYAVVNNVLIVSGQTTFGTALPVSGAITMDLPTGSSANYGAQPVGNCFLIDSATTYQGFVNLNSSTSVRFAAAQVSGSNLLTVNTSSSVPFSWASGDRVRATFGVILA